MTLLLRANSQGEILDADGKVTHVLVRKEAIDWLNGESDFECPPERYFRGKPPRYWWRSVFRDKAGLSAATVNLSAVAVKVAPCHDLRCHGEFRRGWNAALDALGAGK